MDRQSRPTDTSHNLPATLPHPGRCMGMRTRQGRRDKQVQLISTTGFANNIRPIIHTRSKETSPGIRAGCPTSSQLNTDGATLKGVVVSGTPHFVVKGAALNSTRLNGAPMSFAEHFKRFQTGLYGRERGNATHTGNTSGRGQKQDAGPLGTVIIWGLYGIKEGGRRSPPVSHSS